MKRVSGLLGMPVLADGRKVGVVSGVWVEDRRIEGIVVTGKLGGIRVINRESIEVMGDVGVLCRGAGKRRSGVQAFEPKRAVSTGGERIGRVSDVIFDEARWRVTAVEVSPGYIDELLGRRMLCIEFAVMPDCRDVVVCALRPGNPSLSSDTAKR